MGYQIVTCPMASRDLTAGVPSYWGSGGGCALRALFLQIMVSLEILKYKQQFLQHENRFMTHVCKNIASEIILKKN